MIRSTIHNIISKRRRTPLAKSITTLSSNPESWYQSSLISVNQITPSGLQLLHDTSLSMRDLVRTQHGDDRLRHRILATIFYEPSTRTSCSFQAAMTRLGGGVLNVDWTTSSHLKGETVDDTVRCLESFSDVLVLRHWDEETMKDYLVDDETAGVVTTRTTTPVINAGNGVGEHPTQALLDLFTIKDEWKLNDDDNREKDTLTVVMVGDLKHGRTVHSLSRLLARSDGLGRGMNLVLRYCSPDSLRMPNDVKKEIERYDDVTQEEYADLKSAIGDDADVLYVTRIQKERFDSDDSYERVEGSYTVDKNLMRQAPKDMIVMHPLPRIGEIAKDVDVDPRAAYFRQMENGMYVRMAILSLILGKH